MAKIVNSNREFLPVSDIHGQQMDRFLHLATIHEGTREFMCFADIVTSKIYIEEIVGGHLVVIEDDMLIDELHGLLLMSRILDVGKPLLPDKKWLKREA